MLYFQKCEHCNNYGASVACNDQSCSKKFHYTCASSAGCFQVFYHYSSYVCIVRVNQFRFCGTSFDVGYVLKGKCVLCTSPLELKTHLRPIYTIRLSFEIR